MLVLRPPLALSIQVMAGVGPPLFGAERTELILYSLPVTLVHEALETAVAPRSWGLAPKPSHLIVQPCFGVIIVAPAARKTELPAMVMVMLVREPATVAALSSVANGRKRDVPVLLSLPVTLLTKYPNF